MTAEPQKANFAFTKLVVDDLARQSKFYAEVFGLQEAQRIQSALGPDAFEEIILRGGADQAGGSLILLKFKDKAPPKDREVIMGFITTDLRALIERTRDAGGSIAIEMKDVPEMKIKNAYVKDPEGHLIEVVQLG